MTLRMQSALRGCMRWRWRFHWSKRHKTKRHSSHSSPGLIPQFYVPRAGGCTRARAFSKVSGWWRLPKIISSPRKIQLTFVARSPILKPSTQTKGGNCRKKLHPLHPRNPHHHPHRGPSGGVTGLGGRARSPPPLTKKSPLLQLFPLAIAAPFAYI